MISRNGPEMYVILPQLGEVYVKYLNIQTPSQCISTARFKYIYIALEAPQLKACETSTSDYQMPYR